MAERLKSRSRSTPRLTTDTSKGTPPLLRQSGSRSTSLETAEPHRQVAQPNFGRPKIPGSDAPQNKLERPKANREKCEAIAGAANCGRTPKKAAANLREFAHGIFPLGKTRFLGGLNEQPSRSDLLDPAALIYPLSPIQTGGEAFRIHGVNLTTDLNLRPQHPGEP